jgi:hypothetical protein
MELHVSFLWDSVGDGREGCEPFIWVEELVWEARLRCLEPSPFVFNEDYLD